MAETAGALVGDHLRTAQALDRLPCDALVGALVGETASVSRHYGRQFCEMRCLCGLDTPRFFGAELGNRPLYFLYHLQIGFENHDLVLLLRER